MTNRWSQERAWEWYGGYRWLVGCNFTPSTAINQLEMWQADTFDEETIERELGWASEIGFNTARVYLHDLVWEIDSTGVIERINRFLEIASSKGIKPMFVFFDDCWNPTFEAGKQPEPKPGVHNSGWVQSPGP
ncbi:1,4-beta-xylanase, partial [Candidatus Bathyarchaeota archaeon]|nr:1,4-beta-xylanase [Candidatus Bathyarchaeota archaeon]